MDLSNKNKLIKKVNEFLNKQNIEIIFNELDIEIMIIIQSDNIFKKDRNLKNHLKRNFYYILSKLKNKQIKYIKNILLNNNKYFILFIFMNISHNNIFNSDKQIPNEKIMQTIFTLLINMYKNNLISFHLIFLYLQFYFESIENNDIYSDDYVKNIIYIISVIKKLIKISTIYGKDKIDKELLNKDIRQIFEQIFIMNNNTKLNNFIIRSNILKHPKILGILKLYNNYYGDNILNDNNINYIKSNLVSLFSNNFSYRNFEYLYNLSKKYLLNFDNNNDSNYNQKYFSLINGIIKFLMDIHNNQILVYQKGFLDKYFLFDSSKECGIKASPALLKNNDELGLSIIFSFYSIKNIIMIHKLF